MYQLVIDVGGFGLRLPESRKGGYTAYEDDLAVQLEMIPGNIVSELRGVVWRIEYQYGVFWEDGEKDRFIEVCRKGKREPIICTFLPPSGEEMITSTFFVEDYTYPKFYWTTDYNGSPKPMWANYYIKLREVDPHD